MMGVAFLFFVVRILSCFQTPHPIVGSLERRRPVSCLIAHATGQARPRNVLKLVCSFSEYFLWFFMSMLALGTFAACDRLNNPAACASVPQCVFDPYTECRNSCLTVDDETLSICWPSLFVSRTRLWLVWRWANMQRVCIAVQVWPACQCLSQSEFEIIRLEFSVFF